MKHFHHPTQSFMFNLFVLMFTPVVLPTIAFTQTPVDECFWGLHFDLHPNPGDQALGADLSEENINTLLDATNPDFVQYDCKGHAGWLGYPDSEIGPSAPGIKKDSLELWRKLTKERDITLRIHFSGLWDSYAVEQHPEWAAVNSDGSKHDRATSVFGPYVDKHMLPQLKEAVERYDLDGLWVDGECWAAAWDYSDKAIEAWKEKTGYDSTPKNSSEAHWQEWKAFQRQAFIDYVDHWVSEMHEFKPSLQITSNWMYTTFVPLPVEVELDFISGDFLGEAPMMRARLEGRYLAQTGKPWDLMAWGFNWDGSSLRTMKSVEQLKQEAAQVIMQGGGFQVYHQPTRRGYLVDAVINQLQGVSEFVLPRREICHNNSTIPQVGVLLSRETYLKETDKLFGSSSVYDRVQSVLDALLANHYSVDVFAEHQIDDLSEYPIIVISNLSAIKDDFKANLITYVKNGGSLLLIDPKTIRHFEDHLGVKITGENIHYSRREIPASGLFATMQGEWVPVSPNDAKVYSYHYGSRDVRHEGEVAATIHQLGQGKIAAFYGPLSAQLYKGQPPQLQAYLGSLVEELFPNPKVKVDAPSHVEIALRRDQKGRPTLHLLNTYGARTSNRYGYVESVPTVGPIKISWSLDQEPESVTWQPSGKPATWTWNNGVLKTQLDSLHIHDALIIE